MTALQSTDPDIHQEFINVNFVVNENQIPFCAIGVNHALEHINRIMKVTVGLVGITQNASAQERFFLTAPELSRLAKEAQVMAGSPMSTTCQEHHDLSLAVWTIQEENIARLKKVIISSINPMKYEVENLPNIITTAVMPVEVQNDVCNQEDIGQQKYANFVEKCINTNEVSICAKMKKCQLKTWKSARKSMKHKVADQVVELKDVRSLFARMLIVARSRPEMNLKESIGQHEFTSFPRALFTVSGELLPCTYKIKLMAVLQDLPNKIIVDLQPEDDIIPLTPRNATVIDGMAIVQAMGKPPWVKTCAQLADHFTATLDSKCREYDKIHLAFDSYNLPTSLKEATRERRQGRKPATAHTSSQTAQIGMVSAKQFLSSTATKDQPTVYLAKKVLKHFEGKPKVFRVTS